MRTILQGLKNVAVFLLWYGAGYAVFVYVAHFSQIQSLVLAAVALCAFNGFRLATKVAIKQQPRFELFWVRVQPNWYELFKDFRLYDVEKWSELQDMCQAAPAEYSILRDGSTSRC